jgi:hypothetical protein
MPMNARGVALAVIAIALSVHAYAADPSTRARYKPALEVDLDAQAGAIAAAYLHANRSTNPDEAIDRWKKFLAEYANGGQSIEDLTELTFVRQAHLELMRLYYLKGRIKEADNLLRKAEDYVVYSVPQPAAAEHWCRTNKYCD